jgi:sarcosine oxidase delta subunit
MDKERITLENCPFCGKSAELEFDNDHHGEWFNLGCSDEECIARWLRYTMPLDELDGCVAGWNMRVHHD